MKKLNIILIGIVTLLAYSCGKPSKKSKVSPTSSTPNTVQGQRVYSQDEFQTFTGHLSLALVAKQNALTPEQLVRACSSAKGLVDIEENFPDSADENLKGLEFSVQHWGGTANQFYNFYCNR
jgi:hypothetical protein